MNTLKKTILAASILLSMGASAAQAAYTPIVTTTGNNFTFVSSTNGLLGGSNDVTFSWDGTFRTSEVTDNTYNATLSSPTAFSGKKWTMHNVNIYAPGSYVFDTTCVSGNPSCGTGTEARKYNLTVGTGQVGVHAQFAWSISDNIDIVLLWDMNKSWAGTGSSSAFCSGSGAGCNGFFPGNTINTVWNGVSIDTDMDADTYSGTRMIDGPIMDGSLNFNVNGIHAVPVPASLWLFGSGLLGLVGVARRKVAK